MGEIKDMNRDEIAKSIIDSRDYQNMVDCFGGHPEPGEYVITALQAGNFNGEGKNGLESYFGYVVQVRKKAGCYGSDIVLIRHPNGTLGHHENQSYFRVTKEIEDLIKCLFDEDFRPENEDYSEPYTLANGFPETGKVIEPKGRQSDSKPKPFTIITEKSDGAKTVTTIIN